RSKGDSVRDRAETARAKGKDRWLVHGARLIAAELGQAEAEVAAIIEDAFMRAGTDPFPELKVENRRSARSNLQLSTFQPSIMKTVLERLNHALHHAMQADERVYFIGEDILDPYGGAFKVARGLSTKFPPRF